MCQRRMSPCFWPTGMHAFECGDHPKLKDMSPKHNCGSGFERSVFCCVETDTESPQSRRLPPAGCKGRRQFLDFISGCACQYRGQTLFSRVLMAVMMPLVASRLHICTMPCCSCSPCVHVCDATGAVYVAGCVYICVGFVCDWSLYDCWQSVLRDRVWGELGCLWTKICAKKMAKCHFATACCGHTLWTARTNNGRFPFFQHLDEGKR